MSEAKVRFAEGEPRYKGVLNMPPDTWTDVRRILAVRLDNIGDIILLTPALRALRRTFPRARISLLVSPSGSQAGPLLPWVDEVFTHRPIWQELSASVSFDPAAHLQFIDTLRERRFDAAFIFTSFPQTPHPPAYACFLAGIPRRIGQSKEFGGTLLTHWVKPLPDHVHQADRNLFLLESAGIPVTDRHTELRVPEGARLCAERLLIDHGIDPDEPFIVVAPGASCQARRYDARRFARVAALLGEQVPLPVVLVGSAGETHFDAAVGAASGHPRLVSLIGMTTLPELCAVIARSALVIANDSAAMHIADAFNRPVVVLFSGTDIAEQWKPRRAPARLLGRTVRCAPCYLYSCAHAMECLDIEPSEVVREARELLSHAPPGERAGIPARDTETAAAVSGEPL